MKKTDWKAQPAKLLRKVAEHDVLEAFAAGELPKKKKAKRAWPAERSMKLMRDNGWTVAKVEYYMKHPKMRFGKRHDVWNFGDLLICRPDIYGEDCQACSGTGIVTSASGVYGNLVCGTCAGVGKELLGKKGIALVQCCRVSDMAEHKAKILEIPEFQIWKAAGGQVFLQGWRLQTLAGQRPRWIFKEEVL